MCAGRHGTLHFTPAPNYAGPASFTYTVSDGTASSATGTVTITVNPVNDAPVAGCRLGLATVEDTAAHHPSDSPLTPTSMAPERSPDHGTRRRAAVANGTATCSPTAPCTFTPAANYAGPASFTYTISDGACSATGTVTITVTPVNDAPVADDDTASPPPRTRCSPSMCSPATPTSTAMP